MPLRTDREGYFLIQRVVKYGIGLFLNKVHPRVEKKVRDRVENGWKRESTQDVYDALNEAIRPWHPDYQDGNKRDNPADKLAELIDVFCWVYDSDDAYALMFNRFVHICNTEGLVLKPDEKYVKDYGDKGWKELVNMGEAEDEPFDAEEGFWDDEG